MGGVTWRRRMSVTWLQLAKRHRPLGTRMEMTRALGLPRVRVLGDRTVVAIGLVRSSGLVGKEKKVAIPRLLGVTTTRRSRRATKIGKAAEGGVRTTLVGVATMDKATGRKTRAIGAQTTQQPIPRGGPRTMRVGMISARVRASKHGKMGHPGPAVKAGREMRTLVGVPRTLILMEIGGVILGDTIGLLVKVPAPIWLASVGRVA